MKPLAIDLFCGLGGWTDGLLAEGFEVVGFDIERHRYPKREFTVEDESQKSMSGKDRHGNTLMNRAMEQIHGFHRAPLTGEWQEYPAQLVLQDVLTLHGSQFRNAALIVASPPCQEFSYMAMPWTRAKAIAAALRGQGEFPAGYTGSRTIPQLTALFDACFRIQREASEATTRVYGCASCGVYHPATKLNGCTFTPRHIPMVVENVKGAQPWVGRAKANYGSFYLWGDVAMVGNRVVCGADFGRYVKPMRAQKIDIYSDPHRNGGRTAHLTCQTENDRRLVTQKQPVWFNDDKRRAEKCGGDWFGSGADCSLMRQMSSKSTARKAASALIAKIPTDLTRWIARCYWPAGVERVA